MKWFTVPEIDGLLASSFCTLYRNDLSTIYALNGNLATNDDTLGRDCVLEGDITDSDDYYFEVISSDGGTGIYLIEYIWEPL